MRFSLRPLASPNTEYKRKTKIKTTADEWCTRVNKCIWHWKQLFEWNWLTLNAEAERYASALHDGWKRTEMCINNQRCWTVWLNDARLMLYALTTKSLAALDYSFSYTHTHTSSSLKLSHGVDAVEVSPLCYLSLFFARFVHRNRMLVRAPFLASASVSLTSLLASHLAIEPASCSQPFSQPSSMLASYSLTRTDTDYNLKNVVVFEYIFSHTLVLSRSLAEAYLYRIEHVELKSCCADDALLLIFTYTSTHIYSISYYGLWALAVSVAHVCYPILFMCMLHVSMQA